MDAVIYLLQSSSIGIKRIEPGLIQPHRLTGKAIPGARLGNLLNKNLSVSCFSLRDDG